MENDKRLLDAVAKAICLAGVPSWEPTPDWDFVSKNPQNEWYVRAQTQAHAALLVLAEYDFPTGLEDKSRSHLLIQLNEADRRAGAAERRLGAYEDERIKRSMWLSRAKEDAGYSDETSFDVVWAAALKALLASPPRQIEERSDTSSPLVKVSA